MCRWLESIHTSTNSEINIPRFDVSRFVSGGTVVLGEDSSCKVQRTIITDKGKKDTIEVNGRQVLFEGSDSDLVLDWREPDNHIRVYLVLKSSGADTYFKWSPSKTKPSERMDAAQVCMSNKRVFRRQAWDTSGNVSHDVLEANIEANRLIFYIDSGNSITIEYK